MPVKLALGRVREPAFDAGAISELQKKAFIAALESRGLHLGRMAGDRGNVPTDFRYLSLVAAGDPELGMEKYAQGARVGPRVRMPRLPALFKQKRRWRLPEQTNPLEYLEQPKDEGKTWRRNNVSLDQCKEQVLKVLHDQASRGQVLIMSESEAQKKFPNLVVASLGANRKDKPNGEVDGTHGLSVNRRIGIRHQERAPIASD